MVNWATTSSINEYSRYYSHTVTNNYLFLLQQQNFEVRKSNIAMITSVDTQDWKSNHTITVYATGAGDFEYSIDGTYFQDSNQFSNIVSGQYTVHVRDKNGLCYSNRRSLFIDVPQIF
jgi:hypothetical protein